MSELHTYYAGRLRLLLLALLVATFALDRLHTTLVDNHASEWALDASNLLNQHFVPLALLFLGELGIRKWLWRIEKPRLDFHGRWYGTTEYTERWLDREDGPLPSPAAHEVKIRQDCLGVEIAPSAADAFAGWNSLLCDLVPERNGISYAYEVTYETKGELPSKARGYEVLKVIERSTRERPQALSGGFHHLVSDDQPVFSGLARFDREPRQRAWQRLKSISNRSRSDQPGTPQP